MPKILPILTFPAQSLKKPSVQVEKVTSKIGDLVEDMFETMKGEHGIGLAAPQVGENLNILIMNVFKRDPKDPEKVISNPISLINPQILRSEGVIVYEEGCLSCPELLVKMERAQNITVQGLDKEGKKVSHDLNDLEAVCIQHEMDHLRGKLLTDYLSRLKRDIYRKHLVRPKKNDNDRGDLL